ncbi:MAG: tail fiber domain-containing protein [Lysobacteraceae bacterium]
MRSNLFKRNAMAAAVALTICAGNVLAAVQTNAPEVFEQDGKMLFDPAFKAAGYQLTIVGPGDFHRQMLFAGDEALSVSIKSLGVLLDGRYKYEIKPVNGFAKRSNGEQPNLAPALETNASTGSFSIAKGELLLADTKLPEPDPVNGDQDQQSLAKDVIHADDVIVDGSLCVGFDCVNGESFGFDTVRLKENNVRIKFDDTSNSGSFPFVDWQLTANDSANGGANKFSIDDTTNGKTPFTVEANAPSHSLYVDDGGRVGFGTSMPVVELHTVDGDTPTLRLQQDGSSGFAQQTWDVAGNETNFFVRDVNNGSKLPFKIFPNAPTNSLTIEGTTGDIGLGTQTPDGTGFDDRILEIDSAKPAIVLEGGAGASDFAEFVFQEEDGNTGANRWSIGWSANDDKFYIYNYGRGAYDIAFKNADGFIGLGGVTNPANPIQHSNGAVLTAGGVWQNASSRELKEGVVALTSDLAKSTLEGLNPVLFRYIADPGDLNVGFIAEDVPELVATESHKTLSSMDIVAVLTKVLKDQEAEIRVLHDRLDALEAERTSK